MAVMRYRQCAEQLVPAPQLDALPEGGPAATGRGAHQLLEGRAKMRCVEELFENRADKCPIGPEPRKARNGLLERFEQVCLVGCRTVDLVAHRRTPSRCRASSANSAAISDLWIWKAS